MAKGERYTKGYTVQVISTDSDGQLTESIERDTDGALWHVVAGKEPTYVTDDEVSSIVTEAGQKAAPKRDDRDR